MKRQKAESAELGDEGRRAICILDPQPNQIAKGIVRFQQATPFAKTQIHGEFTGLVPGQLHGFHIHTFGDLTKGCLTAGPHYNPFQKTHGGPDSEIRHVGDLGNVLGKEDATGVYDAEDRQV